jgi:molecular chaperone HscB
MPQPVVTGTAEDHFVAMGMKRAFAQDRQALEKRFYELSRELHPDRFTAASLPAERIADAQKNSLDRMSLLNQAYRTLRTPDELRAHLLALEGVAVPEGKKPAAGAIPMGLAEAWFELQDLLAENPEAATHRVGSFDMDLKRALEQVNGEIDALEKSYDLNGDRAELDELARRIQSQSYLRSQGRDVARVRERLGRR